MLKGKEAKIPYILKKRERSQFNNLSTAKHLKIKNTLSLKTENMYLQYPHTKSNIEADC